jgi:mannose-1-phosphate guanylyltransferase
MSTETTPKRKALLLVGGFGTRLRPLTFTKAKPLVEFINKPILVHQIEALKKVGVCEVVLAINYNAEKMFSYLKEFEKDYNIKITVSKEDTPMDTAGPIGLAKSILKDAEDIFVFNADVTCEFPLEQMLAFHKKHGKEGTIATTQVKDPSRFGVIVTDENKKILKFVEKPKEFVGDRINAGLYIFSNKILDRIEPKRISIEREIFPKMAKEEQLYAFPMNGFWADIGKPKDYLYGTELFLNDLYEKKNNHEIFTPMSDSIGKNVVIDKSVKIEEGCFIGPNVVIGAGCEIKSGTRIKNSVLLQNCVIGHNSFIENSIIGWSSHIGDWCRIQDYCCLGEDVTVRNEFLLKNNIILPNVTIKSNPKEGEILLA